MLLHADHRWSREDIHVPSDVLCCELAYAADCLQRSELALQDVVVGKPDLHDCTFVDGLLQERLKLDLAFALEAGIVVHADQLLPVFLHHRVGVS